jgi:pimeloyl-ACP methyl ester carboxylesterase
MEDKRKGLKRARNVLALILFGAFAFYTVAGYLGSDQAIGEHPEWRRIAATPADFGLNAEVVSFNSRDGIPLKACWLPAQGMAYGNLVLAHGRDANRSNMLSRASFLVRNGYNVLALDLRDHGESGGRFITPGYLEALDILGAVDHLQGRGERAPIAVLGHSYGAVAALNAAAQSSKIVAVISDGAFASATELMGNVTRHFLNTADTPRRIKILLRLSRWPGVQGAARVAFYLRTGQYVGSEMTTTLPAVSRMHQPVLFISGEKDFISPTENAYRMFAALPATQKFLFIVPNAGHNTTYKAAPHEYETAVLRFLTEAGGRGPTDRN